LRRQTLADSEGLRDGALEAGGFLAAHPRRWLLARALGAPACGFSPAQDPHDEAERHLCAEPDALDSRVPGPLGERAEFFGERIDVVVGEDLDATMRGSSRAY
jgi:hypothetical protein